jgi:hypothetical protein
MANPGSVAADCHIDRSWLSTANQQTLKASGGTPTYCLDDRAAKFPGGISWRSATRGLLAPGRTFADLASKILIVQYHGYHSAQPSLDQAAELASLWRKPWICRWDYRRCQAGPDRRCEDWRRSPGTGKNRTLTSRALFESTSRGARCLG